MATSLKEAADQAYGTIVSELAAPYFFEKLAAAGVVPASEQEAAEMWALASKLHVLYAAEQEKAAAASVSDLAVANQQLDQLLAGKNPARSQVEKAASFNDVAARAAEQPEIANAVLTLQAAAAAAMRGAQEE